MTKPEVSIIIPCFNCSRTLKEAFDSCFNQDIEGDFEIVMVDDFSADETADLIRKLSKEKSNVKVYFNEKNKGGGATRNIAVNIATSDTIFCLDSDDILPEGTVGKMYRMIKEKKCDGIGIHKSIKFKGADIKNVSRIDEFGYVGERIPFESLIEKKDGPLCPLYSTFMFTKRAFEITGGYSEDHGFDTQSFAWRFLANNLTAYTCPESTYLHRINFNKSYYIREYESGKINHNWFKIFEEFFYLFETETQKEILESELNNPNKILLDSLNKKEKIFKENYKSLLIENSQDNYEKFLNSQKNVTLGDKYWLGFRKIKSEMYHEAFDLFEEIIRIGLKNGYANYYLKLSSEKTSRNTDLINEDDINRTFSFIKQGSKTNIITRIFRKVIKETKKILKKNKFIKKKYYLLIGIKNNIKQYLTENTKYKKHIEQVKSFREKKEIVIDLAWGGLGDALVFTSLPRLLKKEYGIDFYLSNESKAVFRHSDILKLCFEINPYFKGFKDGNVFKYQRFARDRNLTNLFLDINGTNIISDLHRQFNLKEKSLPEIFYKPKKLNEYSNTILVDLNFISGHKLGWTYDTDRIKRYIDKISKDKYSVEYIETNKQDLNKYTDMIYSSYKFITVLSGGAVLAAAINKPAIVFLPDNICGESVYNFIFRDSNIDYIK